MDTDSVAALMRELARTPSRRAVGRALAALASGSAFEPLIGFARVEAKKKGGNVKKWKRYCKAYHYLWCPVEYVLKFCCPQHPDSPAVCTECGCCDPGASQCCRPGTLPSYYAGDLGRCCRDDQTCCFGADGTVECCDQDQICCGGRCCAPQFSAQCCGGTECCHPLETCCSDGQCRLTC
jgi:hypothetical protein